MKDYVLPRLNALKDMQEIFGDSQLLPVNRFIQSLCLEKPQKSFF